MKSYLKDLYENTPVFDEVPMTFATDVGQQNHWAEIAKYLLSVFDTDKDKFLKYIHQAQQYKDQLESKDALVQKCLTRRKKNILNERLPKFPFTFSKVKGNHLRLMEKQYKVEKQEIIDTLNRQKELDLLNQQAMVE